MNCTHRVNVPGGSCGAATRPCALRVIYVDPIGRGWCKRHQPDEERKQVWERITASDLDPTVPEDVRRESEAYLATHGIDRRFARGHK